MHWERWSPPKREDELAKGMGAGSERGGVKHSGGSWEGAGPGSRVRMMGRVRRMMGWGGI